MKKKISIFVILFVLLGLFYDVPCICQESIEKSNSDLSKHETGSFTDPRDGKIYKTVKVGDQWIMAENFAYKPDSGNYWAYDNVDSNIVIYGYLYDLRTALNIAPEGWHLPSYKEWTTIEKLLGAKRGTFSYMEKLYPKLLIGGDSGLDILLGGIRSCDGEYIFLDEMARFWNSIDKRRKRNSFGLRRNQAGLKHGFIGKSKGPYVFQSSYEHYCTGFSVRLFKD